MKYLFSILRFEIKLRSRWRELFIFLALLALFIFLTDSGKNLYLDSLQNKKAFQDTENKYVGSYIFYTQYGTYGIRLMFLNSPFAALHYNPLFDGLLSGVNSGDRMNVYKEVKGKYFFSKKSDYMSFLGFMLLVAAFFSTLYGCDVPGKKAYLRFLSKYAPPGQLFFAIALARIMIMSAVFLVFLSASLAWLRIHGLNLFQTPIFYHVLLIALILLYFFFSGFVMGSLKNKFARSASLACFYCFSFILFPLVLDIHTQIDAADMKSLFKFEFENLDVIMIVEKRLYEKFGKSKDGEKASPPLLADIKAAVHSDFALIFQRETEYREDLKDKIGTRYYLSCLYPVLFYSQSIEELNGCGGFAFIDFNRFSRQRKEEFIDFYVEKKFINPTRAVDVENFIKGDENIYYSQSRVPKDFWFGVTLTMVYNLMAMAIAYFRFKNLLKQHSRKIQVFKGYINLKKGKALYVKVPGHEFSGYVVGILSGANPVFPGTIAVDGNTCAPGQKQDYTYLCSIEDIPGDIKVAALLQLVKGLYPPSRDAVEEISNEWKEKQNQRFRDLDPDDRGKLILKLGLLKPTPIYIIHELPDHCSTLFTLEMVKEVKKLLAEGSRVVYLSRLAMPNMCLEVDGYIIITRNGNAYDSKECSDKRY